MLKITSIILAGISTLLTACSVKDKAGNAFDRDEVGVDDVIKVSDMAYDFHKQDEAAIKAQAEINQKQAEEIKNLKSAVERLLKQRSDQIDLER